MTPIMFAAIIAAASALIGSKCGCLITHHMYRSRASDKQRRTELIQEIKDRKALYAGFLAEVAKIGVMSVEEKNADRRRLLPLTSINSRIELTATKPVIEDASLIVEYLLSLNSPEEKHPISTFLDLKKMFLDAVKKELQQLKTL